MPGDLKKDCSLKGCSRSPACAGCGRCAARHCRCLGVEVPDFLAHSLPAMHGRSEGQVRAAIDYRARRLDECRRLLAQWEQALLAAGKEGGDPARLAEGRGNLERARSDMERLAAETRAWWWLAAESFTTRELLRGKGPRDE